MSNTILLRSLQVKKGQLLPSVLPSTLFGITGKPNRKHDICSMQGLISLQKRDVSMVDCLSFEIMDARESSVVITFDRHLPLTGILKKTDL